MGRWLDLITMLQSGTPLSTAVDAVGCRGAERARLVSPSSGAWSDLVADVEQQTVLILDPSPSRAAMRLSQRGATVAVADECRERAAVRHAMAGGHPFRCAPLSELLERQWDVVCFDGLPVRADDVRAALAALQPGGRLVIVTDNPGSPLRALDRMRGGLSGPATQRFKALRKMLNAEGLIHHRTFGLLRSSVLPACSFDLNSPEAARAVLTAVTTHLSGPRLKALKSLRWALSTTWLSASVVPAWAVVASRSPTAPGSEVVGRIGWEDTTEAKVLLGDPPRELEKWYETPSGAAAEAQALEVLHEAGLDIAPTLLSRPAAVACRMTWRPGHTIPVSTLSHEERCRWVGRASRSLRRIHDTTHRPDGSVLVHGDYWLGNLLIEGNTVTAVIDWASARWGDPATDFEFLVTSLARFNPDERAMAELRMHRDAGYALA